MSLTHSCVCLCPGCPVHALTLSDTRVRTRTGTPRVHFPAWERAAVPVCHSRGRGTWAQAGSHLSGVQIPVALTPSPWAGRDRAAYALCGSLSSAWWVLLSPCHGRLHVGNTKWPFSRSKIRDCPGFHPIKALAVYRALLAVTTSCRCYIPDSFVWPLCPLDFILPSLRCGWCWL